MPHSPKVETFQGENGDWYWRMVAANGETVADSAEGYTRRADAERAARRMLELVEGIAARKNDPEFMGHLERVIEENRDVLDKLAPNDGGDLTNDTEDAA